VTLRLPLGAPLPLLAEPPLVAVVPPPDLSLLVDLSPGPDRSPPPDRSPLPGVVAPPDALWLFEPLDDWPAAPPLVKLRPSFAVTCWPLAGRGVAAPPSCRLSTCAWAKVPVLVDRAATLATAGAGVGSGALPRLLPAKSRVP
jgi:hypothetical protein